MKHQLAFLNHGYLANRQCTAKIGKFKLVIVIFWPEVGTFWQGIGKLKLKLAFLKHKYANSKFLKVIFKSELAIVRVELSLSHLILAKHSISTLAISRINWQFIVLILLYKFLSNQKITHFGQKLANCS